MRGGFAHLHTTRFGPVGNQLGIPAQYGIMGIPQVAENGGLPNFYIGNLTSLGSNNFLPSDEVSQTLQITDDFTKKATIDVKSHVTGNSASLGFDNEAIGKNSNVQGSFSQETIAGQGSSQAGLFVSAANGRVSPSK